MNNKFGEVDKMLGLFKKTDPVCGMKQEKDKGILDEKNWFCSERCKDEFDQAKAAHEKKMKKSGGCCH